MLALLQHEYLLLLHSSRARTFAFYAGSLYMAFKHIREAAKNANEKFIRFGLFLILAYLELQSHVIRIIIKRTTLYATVTITTDE